MVAHSQFLFSARVSLQECAGLLAWNGELGSFHHDNGLTLSKRLTPTMGFPCYAYSIRQDTAGYGRIRQDTAGYGRIRQDMAGYGRIRQDTAGYGRIRQDTAGYGRIRRIRRIRQETAGYSRIRQDTAGYGRIRQFPKYLLVCTTKTTILRSFSVRWYFILFLHAYCDFPG